MPTDKNKKATSLRYVVKDVDGGLDKMSKGIMGYGKDMASVIDPNIGVINFDNVSVNGSLTTQDTLFNTKGYDVDTKNKINEMIYGVVAGNKDDISLSNLVEGRIRLNTEFNYLINNMSELTTSLEALANDVVFPNVSTRSGINITITGNDEGAGETKEDLMKYFRPNLDISSTINSERLFNFDIEKEVHNTVMDLGIYGYQIACTIPYKSIVTDILYTQNKLNGRKENAEYEFVDFDTFSESVDNFFDNIKTTSRKSLIEGLNIAKDGMKSLFENYENFGNIIHPKPYLESDVDEMILYLEGLGESELFKGVSDTTYPKTLSELYDAGKGEDNLGSSLLNLNTVEELKERRSKKFNIDSITGCTYEILDNTRTVPVFIKGQLLGCYVLSEEVSQNKVTLGRNLVDMIGSFNLTDQRSASTYNERLSELIMNDIESILRNNVDKKFIRNNPNLIEDLEYILVQNPKLRGEDQEGLLNGRIRFIPAEYLTLHKIGKGDLGVPLMAKSKLYAHMYIQLMKSDLISKVFLEKPRMKVAVTHTGDTSSEAELVKAMNVYRNSYPRLSDGGVPDLMTDSITAAYTSILIPKTLSGQELLDISQFPTFEGRDNTDFLRQLRNLATSPLGYPVDILDPSQNVDFAKKISNINMHVLVKVLNFQKHLEISLSKLCTKRLRYMKGNNKLEVIVSFESPREITDNITTETIGKVREMIEIYGDFIDNDPMIPDDDKQRFKVEIGKYLFKGVIDSDELDSMYKKYVIEKK